MLSVTKYRLVELKITERLISELLQSFLPIVDTCMAAANLYGFSLVPPFQQEPGPPFALLALDWSRYLQYTGIDTSAL